MSSAAVVLTPEGLAEMDAIAKLPQRPVVFFDGVCGFCNSWVDFLLSRDPDGQLMFAPLQGVTAEQLLTARHRAELSSLVFWTPQGCYRQTAAVVRILWTLGGLWALWGSLLWLVPLPLRDLGYVLVARNRYRLGGKKDACRIPSRAERTRFLP
jgi:predicted DCC family thiol-disulfide oxidoreductase YuxK